MVNTTTDPEKIVEKMRKMKPGGGAALYDAIYMACTNRALVKGEPIEPRRVLVVIGDGHDNASKKTLDQVVEVAQRNLVTIYGISTVAFGFKGGIGTSSRKLPQRLGGFTVGVLVQTNFGGVLTINGAPVGRELGRYYLKDELAQPANTPDGSVIIVIATDAPLDSRNLNRLAARAMMGLARTGAAGSNGSGDYAIAFSTSPDVRIKTLNQNERNTPRNVKTLANDAVSPLFLAVIEATEEAIYNSLFKANTTSGRGKTVEALPLDRTLEILRKHGLTGPTH